MSETYRSPCLWYLSTLGSHWSKSRISQLCEKDTNLETAAESKREIKQGQRNECRALFWPAILFNILLTCHSPAVWLAVLYQLKTSTKNQDFFFCRDHFSSCKVSQFLSHFCAFSRMTTRCFFWVYAVSKKISYMQWVVQVWVGSSTCCRSLWNTTEVMEAWKDFTEE